MEREIFYVMEASSWQQILPLFLVVHLNDDLGKKKCWPFQASYQKNSICSYWAANYSDRDYDEQKMKVKLIMDAFRTVRLLWMEIENILGFQRSYQR